MVERLGEYIKVILVKLSFLNTERILAVSYNHIYQPLRSGRIWHKVNFYVEFNMLEFRVSLLLAVSYNIMFYFIILKMVWVL